MQHAPPRRSTRSPTRGSTPSPNSSRRLATYIGRFEYNDRYGDYTPGGHERARRREARKTLARARAQPPRPTTSTPSRRWTSTPRARTRARAARCEVAPARPQRDRLARAGHPVGVRPHAHRRPPTTGPSSRPASRRCPGALDGYIATLREGIAQGVVPARRQVAEVVTQIARYTADTGLLRDVRRARPHPKRASCRHPSPASSPTTPTPRASRTTSSRSSSAASSPRRRARRMPSAASCTRCSRAASSAPRSTSTRRTNGASRSSPAWSPSRSRSRTRSRPAPRVEEAVAFLEQDATRKLHGTDALQRWMQETSDRAVAELGKTHFDIPEPIRTLRVHDRAHEGRRDLLHRPDRRLLASRPHVVVGARGRRGVRHLARADDRVPRGRPGPPPADRAGRLQPRAAELLAAPARRHVGSRRGLGAVRRAAHGAARLPRRPRRPARDAGRSAHARRPRRPRHRRAPREAAPRRQGHVGRRLRAGVHARATSTCPTSSCSSR